MTYIGVDNGVSGTVGMVNETSCFYFHTPIKRCLNYTKAKQFLNRIDGDKLRNLLEPITNFYGDRVLCVIERPMINPTRFRATISAIRALEATQTILETMKISYEFIDSKEWQRAMLPSGLEKQELKTASLDVGMRLFPSINWNEFDDADGILIAEYARRKYKTI